MCIESAPYLYDIYWFKKIINQIPSIVLYCLGIRGKCQIKEYHDREECASDIQLH